jgi:hypothetical protein
MKQTPGSWFINERPPSMCEKKIEPLKQIAEPGLDSLSRSLLRADLDFLNAEKARTHCDADINAAEPLLSPESD